VHFVGGFKASHVYVLESFSGRDVKNYGLRISQCGFSPFLNWKSIEERGLFSPALFPFMDGELGRATIGFFKTS